MLKDPITRDELFTELMRVKNKGWMPFFEQASTKYNIALWILLAMASRETNCQNIVGDHGHGRGIMQIDDRSHFTWLKLHQNGMDVASSIDYAASILRDNLDHYHGALDRSIAAYNTGQKNVNVSLSLNRSVDTTTANGNYSEDVLYRANIIKQMLQEGNYGQVIETT